jgi:tetratricopeptide (TPR) repeat protein
MRGRVIIAIGLVVVVGAAAAGGVVGDLPLGPAWILGITAGLGLVSTVFSDVALEGWKEQLRRPVQRQRLLAANCLTDARNRLPKARGIADPTALGVRSPNLGATNALLPAVAAGNPPRTPGAVPSYVERDADAKLRDAVRAGGVVVVEGPPGCGKSRTAYEAIRSTAAGRTVVAPRSPQALLRIIDDAFPLRRSVLWLDGLAGFLEPGGPDRVALHRLLAADPRQLLVVATLDSLSHGSTASDGLNMVLLRATVVRLSARWSDAELQRGRETATTDPLVRRAIEAAAASGTPETVLEQLTGIPVQDEHSSGPAAVSWSLGIPAAVPCIGRDSHVAAVISAVTADDVRSLPVLGGPGMGKTTVLRAALHDDAVVERYGNRRLFIRCDGIADADGIAMEVAASLDLPVGPRAWRAARRQLVSARTLVILDNIGPTWEADTAAVEDLLTDLADTTTVSVVVSLRGTNAPMGPDWAPPVTLERLGHDSARRVFLHYAGAAYREDPYLDELVASQDGVPLGLRLMAYAAQGEPNLGLLWRRWVGREASSGVENSYARMDDCIAVSVGSSRMNDQALRLLSILGRLPDGIAENDLDDLLPGTGEFASSDLRKTGLAFEDQGRLRTLRPIREYAARNRPIDADDHAVVIAHYSNLAAQLGAQVGTASGALASARLVAEAGNVEAMLADGLEQPDPTAAIEGVFGLAEFMRWTGLSRSQLLGSAAEAARRHEMTALEAESRYRLGDIALRQCRLDEAAGQIEQALRLFSAAGARDGEAKSIKHLGDVAFEQGRDEVAAEHFLRARTAFAGIDDNLGQAHATKCLGDVAARRGDTEQARREYQDALARFEAHDSVIGTADCLRRIADLDQRAGNHDAADERFDKAALMYEASGAVLGQANCLLGRARTAAERSRFPEAIDLARRAQILYERMAYTRGEAACIVVFGEVAVRRGGPDSDAALEHFGCARSLFRGLHDSAGEAAVCERLADLQEEQTARDRFLQEAQDLYAAVDDGAGVDRTRAKIVGPVVSHE